jgi:hypothetical protein
MLRVLMIYAKKQWANWCREWLECINTFSLPRREDCSNEQLDSIKEVFDFRGMNRVISS